MKRLPPTVPALREIDAGERLPVSAPDTIIKQDILARLGKTTNAQYRRVVVFCFATARSIAAL
jgi:hypothetical protein